MIIQLFTEHISIFISIIAIIISIISLRINIKVYYFNKYRFKIDTTEMLSVEVTTNERNKLQYYENNICYNQSCNMRFVNLSNLPIYIVYIHIFREFGKRYNDISIIKRMLNESTVLIENRDYPIIIKKKLNKSDIQIDKIDYPILINPQETRDATCEIEIILPQDIQSMLNKRYENIENIEIEDILEFLIFDKNVDLFGNKVEVEYKNGNRIYDIIEYPFELVVNTSKN